MVEWNLIDFMLVAFKLVQENHRDCVGNISNMAEEYWQTFEHFFCKSVVNES